MVCALTIACAIGCSVGSAIGANRSQWSTTLKEITIRFRWLRCRWHCRHSLTIDRSKVVRHNHRLQRRVIGRTRRLVRRVSIRRCCQRTPPWCARPTPCQVGREVAGTTCATARRKTRRRLWIRQRSGIGCCRERRVRRVRVRPVPARRRLPRQLRMTRPRVTRAGLICMLAAASTQYCIFSTRVSGTRCSLTLVR